MCVYFSKIIVMDKNSKDIDLKIYCTDVSRAFMEKKQKRLIQFFYLM